MKTLSPTPSVPYLPEVVLLLGTVFWGSSYWVMHTCLEYCSPTVFVTLRFGIASLLLLCLFPGLIRKLNRSILVAGIITGIAGFGGQLPQTWGLQYISISQSAFLTALYVPMVPLVSWFIFKHLPDLKTWIGICLAFIGMVLLAVKEGFSISFGLGDWLTIFSAVSIAFEVVLISKFAKSKDIIGLTFVQMATTSILGLISVPLAHDHFPALHWNWGLLIFAVGVVSVLIQFSINWGQQFIAPAKAAVIYATEPVWGGIFGYMAGDKIGSFALLGGGLVIMGIIISEWPSSKQQDLEIRHE